jgi:hypothetical protein
LKNSLADLAVVHEISELQRKVLTLTELGVRKSKKKQKVLLEDLCDRIGCANPTSGAAEASIATSEDFLFLLPTGQKWWRLTGTVDVDAAARIFTLFLLPLGRPRPHFSTMIGVLSRLIVTASDMTADKLELVRERKEKRKEHKEEDDVATEIK